MTVIIRCKKCGYVFYDTSRQSNLDYLIAKWGSIANFIRYKVHYRFGSRCPKCGRKFEPYITIVVNKKFTILVRIAR